MNFISIIPDSTLSSGRRLLLLIAATAPTVAAAEELNPDRQATYKRIAGH